MTIHQAEQYIHDYQEILADETKRGSRRDPSVLPAPKEWVLKAIKLEMAQLFLLNSHTNESVTRPLINAAMFLDSFSELPFEPSEFIESMHRRRREIDSFYVELLKLDRKDGFYWQRVYAMIGIDVGTKKTTFFQEVKLRFGLGSRSVPPRAKSPLTGNRSAGWPSTSSTQFRPQSGARLFPGKPPGPRSDAPVLLPLGPLP